MFEGTAVPAREKDAAKSSSDFKALLDPNAFDPQQLTQIDPLGLEMDAAVTREVTPTQTPLDIRGSPHSRQGSLQASSAIGSAGASPASVGLGSARNVGSLGIGSVNLSQAPTRAATPASASGSSTPVSALPPAMDNDDGMNVSAYARLDFDSFTFYVQTLQVILGRKAEMSGDTSDVDVHLGTAKAISRRHAKIFYNFATQRFELTVIGRNGAFVGDVFVETGSTVPLRDSTKVQIHQIAFTFVLPMGKHDEKDDARVEEVKDVPRIDATNGGRGARESSSGVADARIDAKGRSQSVEARDRRMSPGVASAGMPGAPGLSSPAPRSRVQAQIGIQVGGVPPPSVPVAKTVGGRDENNFFAHVPGDQLELAQVDAAIAGLPDIPGFDTPANRALGDEQQQALQALQGLDGTNMHHLQLQGLLPQRAGLANTGVVGPAAAAKPKRRPKVEYRPENIPEQYRHKPAHSYSHLITEALRDRLSRLPAGNQAGLSLSDIYEAIMTLFPYYRYCPPGWQNSVRHNLSSSRSFRKVSKEGKGWLWGLDEEYLAEKEKQRQTALDRQRQQQLAEQQQHAAAQQARELARDQARIQQQLRDRDREAEQRRLLMERTQRAAELGVPVHKLANLPPTFGSAAPSPASTPGPDSERGADRGAGDLGAERGAERNPVLPPETVKLLASLQQHVQQELARDGQPPLNPQLLSNALAVVIAQTAKQAGGLQNLGTVLQQPGAVSTLLQQAMQLLRSTQRVPDRVPETQPLPSQVSQPPLSQALPSQSPQSQALPSQPIQSQPAQAPSQPSAPSQPASQPASVPSRPASQPLAQAPSESTATPAQPLEPAHPTPPPAAQRKQPSLEKISEILAKAEAMPNPTDEIKGMIEKLKAHKRQLEMKRAAEPDAPQPKRQAVGN